jgi:hypothetical protein
VVENVGARVTINRIKGNNIEMELDRILQYGVLRLLQIAYPQGLSDDELYWFYVEEQTDQPQTWEDIEMFLQQPKDKVANRHLRGNLSYLQEHDLIRPLNGKYQITARGIDLIANDGGLSAILHTQKVILDEKGLLPLVQALSQSDKQKVQELLLAIPIDVLKAKLLAMLA